MKKSILFFLLFCATTNFAQEKLEMKYRGYGSLGAVAIVISNRAPIFADVNTIVSDFTTHNFKVGLAPTDFDVDLATLNRDNSPFAKDISYVVKLAITSQSTVERVIQADLWVYRMSDGKTLFKKISAPRSDIKMLALQMRKLLSELMPKVQYDDMEVVAKEGNLIQINQSNATAMRRGSELVLQYKEPRNRQTESIALVQRFSNNTVYLKDINNQAQVGDKILAATVQQNRFTLNVGATVSLLGEAILVARNGVDLWRSPNANWPAGFKIEGHYERFLPYNLVSTTVVGINMYRSVDTFVFTGVGYRAFVRSWELVPYFRVGLSYKSLSLNAVTDNTPKLQGIALGFGLNLGMSVYKRITRDFAVGLDFGAQYYPAYFVSMLRDSQKIEVEWQLNNSFQKNLSNYSLFPYLNIGVSWFF